VSATEQQHTYNAGTYPAPYPELTERNSRASAGYLRRSPRPNLRGRGTEAHHSPRCMVWRLGMIISRVTTEDLEAARDVASQLLGNELVFSEHYIYGSKKVVGSRT
jgi:hypothetical protein